MRKKGKSFFVTAMFEMGAKNQANLVQRGRNTRANVMQCVRVRQEVTQAGEQGQEVSLSGRA